MAPSTEAFALGDRLHAGRQASVYRAVRLADGQPVVLKVLDPEHCRAEDVAGLQHEFELGRRLRGLAVLAPLELTAYASRPALVFEPFPGDSLERLVGRPMPVGAFLPLAVSLTSAVAGLHGRGVIHKDLKPGNVLYDERSGQLRLCDLGTATRLARERPAAGPARLIEGSLPYVSPEQTGHMNRALDSRSDLYSLGVTFYELLTGHLPFQAGDAMGWVHAHVARRPAPPAEQVPDLPEVLSQLVLKLLAKEPEARYQSAAGLLHDLQRGLDAWRQSGRIAPFPLGERDLSEHFLIPQRLYGRDAERAELLAAFERVAASGRAELVLVSGYAGIGKSSVVRELHRPIVARRGVFASGKFEQYKREVPYFTLVQAFRERVLDILAEGEEQIDAWRQRLSAALGQNGQLVVELIPQAGLILGPQPPVPALGLSEAEARLSRVFRQFFGAFASAAHPLALFLDDLQWADAASLKLLADLVRSPETRHLLLVGAYRDNEVGPNHTLVRTLEELHQGGVPMHTILLGPLSEADLGQLVADTVRAPPEEAAPLARLVREKSGGNPFFAIQLLTSLVRDGLLALDRAAGRWRWDLPRIQARGYSDNVAELMLGKLRLLPPQTQQALRVAACLGSSFDAFTLALVLRRPPGPDLRPAVEEDLLLQQGSSYRFPHDRVHEAAYALIPEVERPAIHLDIGRLLAAQATPVQLELAIFEVVGQFNRGAARLAGPEERERVAELNLRAGRRARASAAYASALRYLAAGAALLPPDSWERRYELTFALEFHRAECEFLTGDLVAAEARLAALARRARDLVDAAACACVQADLYITRDRSDLAIEACLGYLRRAGIPWSPHPTDAEVQLEFEQMWQRLGSRSIEQLVDLPPMTAPEWQATMEVLIRARPSALFTDERLFCLVVGRMANLSLEHGNCDASSLAYVWLGTVLGPHLGQYQAGFRFARLGLELLEKRGVHRLKARGYVGFGSLVTPWAQHLRLGLAWLQRAVDAAVETGDLTYGAYAHNGSVTLRLAAGEALSEVQRAAERGLDFARRTRFGLVVDIITTQLQLLRSLQGQTPSLGSFDDPQFDEGAFEQHLEADPHLAIAACWYWIRKLQGRLYANDYPAALAAAEKAQRLLWTSGSFFEVAEYRYFGALALAAQHEQAPAGARPGLRRALAEHRAQLELWAEHCPENFRDRAALVGAELARLEGRSEEAERLYELAFRSAHEGGFVQNEALAYETAARFYQARGLPLFASACLREARDRYRRWGAEGKVRQLELQHPHLAERAPLGPKATTALQPEQLDLLAVLKASQTISSEMARERLLRTLLQVVLEEGGARRARLVLLHRGGLEIAAEASVDEPSPAQAAPMVPEALLRYAQRTGEPVLLDDAQADPGRFAGDPYLARARPRSVLALPVRRQAEVVALLYLENELVPGAFTRERLQALELLAAQAAISLENTHLLELERAGRLAAEAGRQRALLLDEATALMSSTLEREGLFGALARLCAQSFADWAVIDLLEDGEVVRLAGAHRDPAREPLLRELAQRYPARLGTAAPATRVFQSWAPLHLDAITDEQIRASAVDDHHAELIRLLGTRSAVVVPLMARSAQLGVLTLASAQPHRFERADVELAVELGRRAALALDNTRLLHQTQQALHLREEFLMVASHELRTPLTSLRLAVDYLLRSAASDQPIQAGRQQRLLRQIRLRTGRLEQLTGELLDVTRIEHGELGLEREEVELGALARRAVEQLGPALAQAHCPTSVEAPYPVLGYWDPSRLEQVVTNLLTNALKFGAGRPIELSVGLREGRARLVVRDHGIGVDPARQARVFERFGRAVPATSYGGLGLGLFIARAIVQAHGGTIALESRPGQGATFTVELPTGGPSQEAPGPGAEYAAGAEGL